MRDRAFLAQLQGYGLTTAEVHYYRPAAPSLLQLYVWQEYDLAPDFPVLFDFLDHWRREIEAALHSVHIAPDQLVRPTEWRAVDGVLRLHCRGGRCERGAKASAAPPAGKGGGAGK